MKTSIAGVFAVAVLLTSVVPAHAAALTEGQIQAILSLLSSFGADAAVVTNVDASLRGKAVSAVATAPSATPTDRCLFVKALTRTLSEGLSDSETAGEVTALQKFLAADSAVYPEGKVTGYFGPATKRAVGRWQTNNSVVANPEASGYGIVGALTRSAIAKNCGYAASQVAPSASPAAAASGAKSAVGAEQIQVTAPGSMTVNVGTKITVTYVVGSGIVPSDPAIVERGIVNTNTNLVVSGQAPLTLSKGTYTFEWTPSEAGTYQALVNLRLNSMQYPARSGVITVVGNSSVSVGPIIPSLTLTASPPTIPSGQGTTLVWSATSANKCVLKYDAAEDILSTTGGKTVTPTKTTTYLVWCTNEPYGGGVGPAASASVTVYVTTTYQ